MHDTTDLWAEVADRVGRGDRVDYVVADEAHFYLPEHVEQLARVVDDLEIDVFAFGLSSDFRRRLFPASARFVELADRVQGPQVEALCWCGKRATHNARTVDGVMELAGEQVVVGDVDGEVARPEGTLDVGHVGTVAYEVLCRRHHVRRRATATATNPATPGVDLRQRVRQLS